MLRCARLATAALAACFALALLAGPAAAAEAISAAEIQKRVIGNTVVGEMNDGHAYAEFYPTSGVVVAEDYTAIWTIEGDRMCFDYSRADKSCFAIAFERGKLLWLQDGKVVGEGHVLDGNPYEF